MENILGKRIEIERIRIGINQIELAKRLSLSSSASISQYESGERTPSDDIKLKMCEIFNCSMDYLVGRTDIRNPEQQEDPLGLAKIGFSMKDYNPPTETQKQQIKGLLEVIMKDNKKDVGDKKNESK